MSGLNAHRIVIPHQGLSECYECTPPPATKTFPGCTIRNTPSQPIHCIVWAKHLFSQLFGEPDVDNDVSPETEDPENTHDMEGKGDACGTGFNVCACVCVCVKQ